MSEPRHTQDGSIVDVVDRAPKRDLHGVTWRVHADAMLDEISRLQRERDKAMTALRALAIERPELEHDEHFALACLALL
jgi:hypothetical protein